MPTVIDSLIVTLGLDTKDVDAKAPGVRKRLSELEKGADGTDKNFQKIKKTSKETGSELSVLTSKMASFLAVIGGTVVVRAFVKDAIDTNTQLSLLSKNLEVSTQKLFSWGAATKELGGNQASMQNFMKSLAGMRGQLATGQTPQMLPLLARFGINMNESPDQIMLDLAQRFSGMDRKFAFSFGMANGINEDVMNLLLQGPKAVAASQKRTSGFAPTDKEVADAAKLKMQLVDIGLQFTKIGYDVLEKVTPFLEKFFSVLQSIGEFMQRHEKIVTVIAGIIAAFAGFSAIATIVGGAAMAFAGLSAAIAAAIPIIASLLPVFAVVGIVLTLASAIMLLWDDYQVWASGGKSLFDWSAWVGWIEKAKEAWSNLGSSIENAISSAEKWYNRFASKHGLAQIQNPSGSQSTISASDDTRSMATRIAKAEGFYSSGSNIPNSAHNPGDIEYGPFAISHGATGSVTAKGGKQIAVFPNDASGFSAMYALLGTKGYAGLSPDQTLQRWQTGKIFNGIANSTSVPSSITSGSGNNTHTDNSKTTHVGTVIIQSPEGGSPTTTAMARGMDWNTLLSQQNMGLLV